MKKWMRDNWAFLAFLLLLGVSRTSLADWNHIPSGSMRPTLLEGDMVLVDRIAYDLKAPFTNLILKHLGDPSRGDVVVFYSPKDDKRLIKRVVGLPGDTIEMRRKVLVINGQAATYELAAITEEEEQVWSERFGIEGHDIQWDPRPAVMDSFGPITIPPDHFLMLGDNRDHSADSRYFGFVPRNYLIGRAERILVSADANGYWAPRFERFGRSLRR